MQTYTVSFYPGMILPKQYFVTVDEKTTDYQAIMDILADRLSKEGVNVFFDDNEEVEEDQITICGNESRRLITGGMLNIRETTKEDVKQIMLEIVDCYPVEGTVNIGFYNDDIDDQTEFDIKDIDELVEVWIDFCKENNLDITSIIYVSVFGCKEVEVNFIIEETAMVRFKVPYSYDEEQIKEEAILQEEQGNAIFSNRKVREEGISKIAELSSDDLYNQMSPRQLDDIYRMVWLNHVIDDVSSRIEDNLPIKEDFNEEFRCKILDVAERIVYEGKLDSNLTYWDNIDNLLERVGIK